MLCTNCPSGPPLQMFSKCGPWTKSFSASWKYIKNSQLPPNTLLTDLKLWIGAHSLRTGSMELALPEPAWPSHPALGVGSRQAPSAPGGQEQGSSSASILPAGWTVAFPGARPAPPPSPLRAGHRGQKRGQPGQLTELRFEQGGWTHFSI